MYEGPPPRKGREKQIETNKAKQRHLQRISEVRGIAMTMLKHVRAELEQGKYEGPVTHDISDAKGRINDSNTWCITPLREHTAAEKKISGIIREKGKEMNAILQRYAHGEVRPPSL